MRVIHAHCTLPGSLFYFFPHEPTSDGGRSCYPWDHHFYFITQDIINKMSNQAHTNTCYVSTCCLPPYCSHFNKFSKVPFYICKDPTSGTEANGEADVPNEENMAEKGGIIQLVSGKVNVLHSYVIQGEHELTTPSLYMTMSWQVQVGCSVASTVLPPLLHYNLCISRCSECTTTSQKLFERLVFISRQPSTLCSSAAAGVFSVHGTGW